jgi:preprotein translocase subunit SecG
MGAAIDGAPAWNRFAHWPRGQAQVLLAVVLVLLVESASVPMTVGRGQIATPPPLAYALGENFGTVKAKPRPRDDDLALYDAAIARIRKGESYYSFIVAEHRKAHYPVRPAVAVRLPTLAYFDALAGLPGQIAAAIALMLAVLWAWWQRLGDEPGGLAHRNMAVALLFTGAALGLNRTYFVLHELWAGMLIALAFGLHRPAKAAEDEDPPPDSQDEPDSGKWRAAWCAAALALAIREHTLPFVLLLAAYAGWRQAWHEAQAWADLAILFAIGYCLHLHVINTQALPSDHLGPSWFALRGLGGWLSNITLSSNLRFLPNWAAGPMVLLMILGWAGWRSHAGSFATLLYLGYGAAFMIAGRDDNFYWGAMIAPTMFIGLAFVPMALRGLVAAALGTVTLQTAGHS